MAFMDSISTALSKVLEPSFFEIPFCEIYFKERGETPFLSATKEKMDMISCKVEMDSDHLPVANVNFILFPDTVDLEMNGIHEGLTMKINMGYKDITTFPLTYLFRTIFVGKTDRPTVNYEENGCIKVSLKAKGGQMLMNFEPKTFQYPPVSRMAIVQKIMTEYIIDFPASVVAFSSMAKIEKNLHQINRTDYGFLSDLAKQWNCIFYAGVSDITDELTLLFVDNTESGRNIINTFFKKPMGYFLIWRTPNMLLGNFRNVKSLTFSGEASAHQSNFNIDINPVTGVPQENQIVEIETGDDAGTWELQDKQVENFIKNKGPIEFFNKLKFSSQEELRKLFWKKIPATKRPRGQEKGGLGGLGHRAEFQLIQGDVNIEPNMSALLEGDIMSRHKNMKWKIFKITHSFDKNGFHTSGTLGA